MKVKTLLTTIIALTFCTVQAQEELNSAMVFETYEWDFGQINEADGVVQHTFRFITYQTIPSRLTM